ncbi:hypothetical protein BJ508DRAFT_325956 [Ascobolus immersus RN42]|uniref:Uncharacterized protein n=1 Tax=Ascobolus immersus RN42 TaxID=1160509 RepID=A0A3N4IJW2_ASCIM|nr:hypothetical protein BJ508DRAFT_325956 [Ascobolus immersus RN42]
MDTTTTTTTQQPATILQPVTINAETIDATLDIESNGNKQLNAATDKVGFIATANCLYENYFGEAITIMILFLLAILCANSVRLQAKTHDWANVVVNTMFVMLFTFSIENLTVLKTRYRYVLQGWYFLIVTGFTVIYALGRAVHQERNNPKPNEATYWVGIFAASTALWAYLWPSIIEFIARYVSFHRLPPFRCIHNHHPYITLSREDVPGSMAIELLEQKRAGTPDPKDIIWERHGPEPAALEIKSLVEGYTNLSYMWFAGYDKQLKVRQPSFPNPQKRKIRDLQVGIEEAVLGFYLLDGWLNKTEYLSGRIKRRRVTKRSDGRYFYDSSWFYMTERLAEGYGCRCSYPRSGGRQTLFPLRQKSRSRRW